MLAAAFILAQLIMSIPGHVASFIWQMQVTKLFEGFRGAGHAQSLPTSGVQQGLLRGMGLDIVTELLIGFLALRLLAWWSKHPPIRASQDPQ